MTRLCDQKIIEALKEGGKIPEMLNSLRVHHMQQEAFRMLLAANIQNPLFKDKRRAITLDKPSSYFGRRRLTKSLLSLFGE